MFIIIEPDIHNQHKKLIKNLHLNVFNRNSIVISKAEKKQATYFLALNTENKYLGGAWLIKRFSKNILINTRLISKHLNNGSDLWECGGIHVMCEKEEDFSIVASIFYTNLYKQLVDYSKKQGIQHMCVHNTITEKENTLHFGKWPMVGQIIDVYHCNMFYSFLNLNGELEE